jgi:thiol-disulfide isomerase/thioredoxin
MSRPPTQSHRLKLWSRSRRFPLIVASIAVLFVLATACGEQASAPAADTAPGTPTAAGGQQATAAASVTAATADGTTVTVPDGKPAVVYFFAPSCYSCIAGTRAVANAQTQAPEAADYVAVNIDPGQNAQSVRDFLTTADGTALARTTDTGGELASAFNVRALGTLIVLDADGTVVHTDVDPPAEAITAAVEKAAAA